MSDTQTLAKPLGRPRTKSGENDFFNGELYKLLESRLSHHVYRGQLNVTSLAKTLGMSRMSVYRWLHEDKLSPNAAKLIVAESSGAIKDEDMLAFVLA